MKKLNNKGFAIASILYSIMVLFLMLLLSILGILGSRKATLDKNKKDIINSLNQAYVVNKFTFEHKDITIVNTGNLDDITYALMDGVKAIDAEGNEISKEFIRYDLNINNIENKAYNVTYTANSNGQTIVGTRLITFTPTTNITTFAYKGSPEEFTPDYNGAYKIELWGASGGDYETALGGAGAYTKGNIKLSTENNLFVYVGSHPSDYNSGYNGGGLGGTSTDGRYTGGGGATDIRLENGTWSNFDSLKSRIMVAAGGAGTGVYFSNIIGGAAGGLIGNLGTNSKCSSSVADHSLATPGTQTSFGLAAIGSTSSNSGAGSFGYSGITRINQGKLGTGGGSGYYGGGNGSSTNCNVSAGAGGSSFISGYDGCDAISEESTSTNIIHTGQSIHYSGYKFDNPVMYAGNEVMPTHDGTGTMTGNSGDGYAKISLIYYY